MKKNLKLLLVIPLYILLVVFNNCRNVFSNIKQNISLFNNIEFFNIAILVSLIMFCGILLLRNRTNKYNKIVFSSLFVILGTSILNGIFIDKNISMFIVVYFYLLFISIVTMILTKQKFEISLVIGVSVLLLFMTVLAIVNLLFLFKYLILVFVVLGLIFILFNIKNNNFYDSLEKMNCYGIVIFAILFLVAVCGGINRYVHTYDEYSHWAFDAKAVITYDKLSTCQEVVSRTRSYPPVITLWHYFINIFIGTFIEQNLYIGLSIFITIFLMPAFSVIEKKNRILLPFLIIVIPFSCYLFSGVYGYETLYADLAFSVILACCFVYDIIMKNNVKRLKYLTIILTILTLTKPTGILASLSFILILLLCDFFEEKDHSFKGKIILLFKKYWKLILCTIGVFVLWNIYVKVSGMFINDYYSFELLPDTLKRSLDYKLNPNVIATVIFNLLASFSSDTIYGIFNLSWFNYIFITFLLFAFISAIFNSKNKINNIMTKVSPYLIGYMAYVFLTFLSIFCTFTLYETKELASFDRYVNTFNFAIMLYLIIYISRSTFFNGKFNKIITICILSIIIINIPFSKFTYFISDYNSRLKTRQISYELKGKFEIVNKNTETDSQIFILDQQDKDGIMALWYGRYYMFPRRTNASQNAIAWKIRTDKNIEDLGEWGLKAEELGEVLIEYNFDYLFLYTYDEQMLYNMRNMFTDIESISGKYTLFKIEKDPENKVKLEPIA